MKLKTLLQLDPDRPQIFDEMIYTDGVRYYQIVTNKKKLMEKLKALDFEYTYRIDCFDITIKENETEKIEKIEKFKNELKTMGIKILTRRESK